MAGVLVYVWLGVGTGGLYALIASGLLVLHKGSGVVNLALGAVAMVTAYTFSAMQPNLGTTLAALVSIAISAALGLAAYVLVMRPLRGAPPLATLVASLGVMLVLQAAILLGFNDVELSAPTIFVHRPYSVFGADLQPIRLFLFLFAIVLSVVLALVFSRTRFGIYTEGSAETEKGVTLIGRSPTLIAAVNWVLGCSIAGLAGVAATTIVGLQVENLVLLVVPGLTVALFARFSSFILVAVAGVALGVIQSVVSGYWAQPLLRDVVPFAALVVVLMSTGAAIPDRGTIATSTRSPEVTPARPTLSGGIALSLAIVGIILLPAAYQSALIISMITAIISLSLLMITGFVGQLSLAQFVLAGIGGFATSKFAYNLGWPFPLPLLAAALVSAAAGFLIGIPSLRVRGYNLAVLTLAAAVTVQSSVFNNISLTGSGGGSPVPAPMLGSFSLDPFGHPIRFGLMVLAILVFCAVATAWLRNSRIGLRLLAVRDNERAAATAGWSIARTKLLAFTLSAALAGIGGSLLAYQGGIVGFYQFTPLASILLVGYLYVAGIGSLSGTMLAGLSATGGLIVTWLQFLVPVGHIQNWVNLSFAAMVLVAVVVQPDGVMPFHGHQAAAIRKAIRRWRGVPDKQRRATVPSTTAADRVADVERRLAERVPVDGGETEPILEVDGLTVRFGSVAALDDLDLQIAPGFITGLIGPNGSGKSTFVDAVAGFVPNVGDISLSGVALSHKVPHLRARAGLSRTFQSLELFEQLSVYENVESGVVGQGMRLGIGKAAIEHGIYAELDRFGLGELAERMPSEISSGQRRLLAVARALASRPQLLILDEPASGLDYNERERLRYRLQELALEGASVLLIEHDVDLVFDVCDFVNVLDNGRLISSGRAAEVRMDPAVIAAYLGQPVGAEANVTSLEAVT